ncbi:uncharacterized protein EI97DRAFT_419885 [Westerdykella ornata]|uniref:Beta-glucuronidase C-terminal domain-containing protein n=1 Tax=Westerdykella ornata TaxID=318751 RepID=A0A6A6JHK3_WESOR|nr:uncharacterized protein EI97DRAFT_419885 [Westerdykella ornata]KAF2275583.1 hypothetical protein EI97DRAFT_419885 [Westerdykella ornata]
MRPSRRFSFVLLCPLVTGVITVPTRVRVIGIENAADAVISNPLDPSFAGFGIESSNLFDFTGHEEPNRFSLQLLQNLAEFSGRPPYIRVGGNTQDYMLYDKNHSAWHWINNPSCKGRGTVPSDSMVIGPRFFESLDRLPSGTPLTLGLNLGYVGTDYEDKLVEFAAAAVNSLKNVMLRSFEIGNEPDLYLQNQLRAGAWAGDTYTSEFLHRAKLLYEKVLEPAGLPSQFFEPPSSASTIGNTFEILSLAKAGLLGTYDGREYVASWNQHNYFYFIGVSKGNITIDRLLNLDATDEQFAYWKKQVAIAIDQGRPYALREMSCVGPLGLHGVSDTFASALWAFNFLLYAATLNISSVQMHVTDNSYAAAWKPTDLDGVAPHVRPQYYAHAAMAQIIGSGNGTTQIGAINLEDIPEQYKGYIRAYSVYCSSVLSSIILINSKPAMESEDNKANFIFDIQWGDGSERTKKKVLVSYLTAPGADSFTGVVFNGMSFSDIDGTRIDVDDTVQMMTTNEDGVTRFQLRDSAAAVLRMDNVRLGTEPVATSPPKFTMAPKGTKSSSSTSSIESSSTSSVRAATSAAVVGTGPMVVILVICRSLCWQGLAAALVASIVGDVFGIL